MLRRGFVSKVARVAEAKVVAPALVKIENVTLSILVQQGIDAKEAEELLKYTVLADPDPLISLGLLDAKDVNQSQPTTIPLFQAEGGKDLLFALSQFYKQDPVAAKVFFASQAKVSYSEVIWGIPQLAEERKNVAFDYEILTYVDRVTKGSERCGKCGGQELSYAISQRNAGDEAAKTFIRCKTCNNKWVV
jgi:DNA-directed RNA polymerase subunit M/transcription elongation factor TFIIS